MRTHSAAVNRTRLAPPDPRDTLRLATGAAVARFARFTPHRGTHLEKFMHHDVIANAAFLTISQKLEMLAERAPNIASALRSLAADIDTLEEDQRQLLVENKMILDQLDAAKSIDSRTGRAEALHYARSCLKRATKTIQSVRDAASKIEMVADKSRAKNAQSIRDVARAASNACNVASYQIARGNVFAKR